MNSRFTYSDQFKRTNFAFGDDVISAKSTNKNDFSSPKALLKLPATVAADDKTCSRDTVPNISPERKPGNIDITRLPVCQIKNDVTHRVPDDSDHSPNTSRSAQKKALQKTNFTFGNDENDKVTAYQEFASQRYGQCRNPCSPPKPAQVFPQGGEPTYKRTNLRRDYTYFGSQISDGVYQNRTLDLDTIKGINTQDSVGKSLLGKRRKILTRSMIDYRHPLDRVRGNVKLLMVRNISPAVRIDSIWSSVNSGGSSRLLSEIQTNYPWPIGQKSTKRFYRGQMNKVR